MNNGIGFNLKKKLITIKVDKEMEDKDFIIGLKKKMPELKKVYKDVEPQISIIGKEFKNRDIYQIQKIVAKYFDVDVNFDCSKRLGLYGIRKPFKKEIATSDTKFIRTSLRSGQKIEFEGSVVVLGDVNCGAEVIAGENIVILGTLRGLAHAGAKGNKEAIIAAASIESAQIRIADIVKEIEKESDSEEIAKYAYVNKEGEIILTQ